MSSEVALTTAPIWRAPGPTVLPAAATPTRSQPAMSAPSEPQAGRGMASTTELTRVTVAARRGRVDIALPVDATLAELLPTILSLAGDQGRHPDGDTGWVLQRLGHAPLDAARTVGALGIREGEVLHLMPARAPLPEAKFDDVLDAVATASRDRARAWSQPDARRFALAVVVGALFVGAALVASAGPHVAAASVVAGCSAFVLLVAATVSSRAFGQGEVALTLVVGALPYAAFAGPIAEQTGLSAATLVLAASGAALVAVLGAIGVGGRTPEFGGVILASLVGVIAAVACGYGGASAAASAAGAMGVLIAAMPLIPGLAFRLARIPLPAIPTGVADLRADSAAPAGALTALAGNGDRWITSLVATISALSAACAVPVVLRGGWGLGLTGVAGAVLLLRARLFSGRAQRLWCLSSGVGCLAAVMLAVAARSPEQRLIVLLPLGIMAGVAIAVSVRDPDRRPSPVTGRLADIAEVVFVVSMLPLAGAVLDLYGYLRNLAG